MKCAARISPNLFQKIDSISYRTSSVLQNCERDLYCESFMVTKDAFGHLFGTEREHKNVQGLSNYFTKSKLRRVRTKLT